jgi:GTP-binding protein
VVREDECVEVTPDVIRLRKVALDQVSRVKAARRRAKEPVGG